jgi:hypothetical protein
LRVWKSTYLVGSSSASFSSSLPKVSRLPFVAPILVVNELGSRICCCVGGIVPTAVVVGVFVGV